MWGSFDAYTQVAENNQEIIVYLDENQNIREYVETTPTPYSFPCCKDYGQKPLRELRLYTHIRPGSGTTCNVDYQDVYQCTACAYTPVMDNNWRYLGSHNIISQKGWNYCPY